MTKEIKLLKLILNHRYLVFLFCFFPLLYFTHLVIRESESEYNSRKTYTTIMEIADPTSESWIRMIYLDAVASDFVTNFGSAKSLSTELGQTEFNSESVLNYIAGNVKTKSKKNANTLTSIEINHEDSLTPNLIVLPILDKAREQYFFKYEKSIQNSSNLFGHVPILLNHEFINVIVNKDVYIDDFVLSMKTSERTKNYLISNKILSYTIIIFLLIIIYFFAIFYVKARVVDLENMTKGEWRLV